jgi:hypothetical protein
MGSSSFPNFSPYRISNINGVFSAVNIAVPNLGDRSFDFADFDNDGDLDAAYFGAPITGSIPKGYIYINDGFCGFTLLDTLTGFKSSNCKWLDADNDGDQDLFVTGISYNNQIAAKMFENQNGNFVSIPHNIIPVKAADINLGDYDNDGDLDLMITGNLSYGYTNFYTYRNDNGVFNSVNLINITSQLSLNVDWVDYDSDGDLDIYYNRINYYNWEITAKIGVNDNGIFHWIHSGIKSGAFTKSSWGDYDNDGDPDLLTIEKVADNLFFGGVFKNRTFDHPNFIPNTIPLPPSQINAVTAGDSIVFSWNSGTDNETPNVALTYNLAVGTSPFIQDIFSSNSDILTGFYRLAVRGNVGNTYSRVIRNITQTGWIYYRVQSIDGQYRASNWSTIDSVYVDDNSVPLLVYPYINAQNLGFDIEFKWTQVTNALNYQLEVAYDSLFTQNYFTINNLNDTLHLQTNLINNTYYYWRVKANFANGTSSSWSETRRFFVNQQPNLLTNSILSSVVFYSYDMGDYDADGDMDMLACISFQPGKMVKVYTNNNSNFTEVFSYTLASYSQFAYVKFADYNNDNKLDFILSSSDTLNGCLRLFENQNNSFSADTLLLSYNNGYGALPRIFDTGDYDNDGDIDILNTGGSNDTNNLFHHPIVWNNQNGHFVPHNFEIEDSQFCGSKWVDVDNDGDLDIVTRTNHYYDGTIIAKKASIYKNELDSFIFVGYLYPHTNYCYDGFILSGFHSNNWGDYDNDGDLDCMLPFSKTNFADSITIFRNEGNFQFTRIDASNQAISGSDNFKWGDYDNDGDLDLLSNIELIPNVSYIKQLMVMQNDNGVFSPVFPGVHTDMSGLVSFLDIDNDHDLDLYIHGIDQPSPDTLTNSLLYTNPCFANTPPDVVQNIVMTQTINNDFLLSWNQAHDNQTPSLGLTYNVEIKNTATNNYVLSPCSDAVTGKLFKPGFGNAMQDTFMIFRNLPSGTFTVRVQAVDNTFETSTWSAPVTFMNNPVHSNDNSNNHLIAIYPNPANDVLNIKTLQMCKINAVRIFDGMGNIVSQSIHGNQIDISKLSAGLYFIEINTDKETTRLTFTKI